MYYEVCTKLTAQQGVVHSKEQFTDKRKGYIAGFLEPVFSLGLFVIDINNLNNRTEKILINLAGDEKLRQDTELHFKTFLTIQETLKINNKENIQ